MPRRRARCGSGITRTNRTRQRPCGFGRTDDQARAFALPNAPLLIGTALHLQALVEESAGTGDVRPTSLVSTVIQSLEVPRAFGRRSDPKARGRFR